MGCYLTCAEGDVKQPSDSLAGANRRPVTTVGMGSGLIDDGALSVLAQFVRVVVYTKGALGKVQWADAGARETAINRRGTRLPQVRLGERGSRKERLGISCSCFCLGAPGCRKGRSNCARGASQSHRRLDAFH